MKITESLLQKAQNRLTGLKENAKAQAEGKSPVHDIKGDAGLKESAAYIDFIETLTGAKKPSRETKTINNSLKEMLTSTDVMQLIPQVIEGEMIEAAEPELLFSKLFHKIDAPSAGVVIVVPIVGEIFAKEVGEGEPYNEDAPDFTTMEQNKLEIRVKKVGIKVSITDEVMSDFSWDIYNMTVRKIGRAFARFKEEKCFNEATIHGNVIFDNAIREQRPEAGTTGLGIDGKPNNTFSIEDFLDLMLASITNHHTPTDFFAHPLIWTVFARNAMIGAGMQWGALGGQNVHPAGGTQGSPNAGMQNNMGPQSLILTPEQVQNRLPFALTVNLSPFVKFDKEKKLFDCYVIDRENVGVIVQKSDIKFDNWTDPNRDIQYVKANERYGVGISDNGLGIMVARNCAVDVSYPKPVPVHVIAN